MIFRVLFFLLAFSGLAFAQDASVGAALGWKFDHEPGIRTRAGEIIAWPARLGPRPNAAQIAIIVAEYEAFLSSQVPPLSSEEIADLLVEKGLTTRQEIDDKRGSNPGRSRTKP